MACPVRMGAKVPDGRAVTSGICADPKRPIPSPATTFRPTSSFLGTRGTVALAPRPPPILESLKAPAGDGAVAVGAAPQLSGAPTRMVVAVLALGLTAAQGERRSRKVLTRPNSS